MAVGQTTGAILRELWQRSGLSQRAFAVASGYNAASGVQRFVEPAYDKALAPDIAQRFATALEGKGNPPILRSEILALTGLIESAPNAIPVRFEGAPLADKRMDLPVYGTALGAAAVIDGEAIEQTELNSGEIIAYVERPPVLNGVERAYGLYMQGSSMAPRYDEGELIVATEKQPPRVGDDVVIYLRPAGDGDDGERARMVMVKRLVRRTAAYCELRQFEPDLTFRIPAPDILKMHRVVPPSEWLATR